MLPLITTPALRAVSAAAGTGAGLARRLLGERGHDTRGTRGVGSHGEVTEVFGFAQGGMLDREADLRAPVAAWLEAELGPAVIADEIDLGWGAPDLVAAVPMGLSERLATGIEPVCSAARIWALSELAEPRTEAQLRTLTSSSWARYRAEVLDPLHAAGLVSRDDAAGTWQQEGTLAGVFPHAIAVELKLRDWRRAISQAGRYRAFADSTYIAMPAARLSADALAEAQARCIGVLAVGEDGVECLLRSQRHPALDERVRALVSEMVLASFLGVRQSAPAGSPRGRRVTAVPAA
jgi:hypothetical protein